MKICLASLAVRTLGFRPSYKGSTPLRGTSFMPMWAKGWPADCLSASCQFESGRRRQFGRVAQW